VNDQGARKRPAFRGENAAHSRFVEGIRGEAVYGLGGDRHKFAGAEQRRSAGNFCSRRH
jgi:hypothetical protein